jgi:hypothetical protein
MHLEGRHLLVEFVDRRNAERAHVLDDTVLHEREGLKRPLRMLGESMCGVVEFARRVDDLSLARTDDIGCGHGRDRGDQGEADEEEQLGRMRTKLRPVFVTE